MTKGVRCINNVLIHRVGMDAVKEMPILAALFCAERLFQKRKRVRFKQTGISHHERPPTTHLLKLRGQFADRARAEKRSGRKGKSTQIFAHPRHSYHL